MLPVRLELHNFLAYRDPNPIRFEGLGVACLNGPNGAGKSSLLDAMTWALWGRSRVPGNRSDDELIHMGQTEMSVTFDFRHEQSIYRVIRKYSKRGGRNQSTLELLVFDQDGRTRLLNEDQSIRLTQEQITKLLRLDYETFIHSAFVQQGKADAFTVKTPAERKKILAEVLGLKRWDEYEDQARERLQAISEKLATLESLIAEKEAQEAEEEKLRQEYDATEKEFEQARVRMQAAEEMYNLVSGAPQAYQERQRQLLDAKRRIEQLQSDLDAVNSEASRQQERLMQFQEVIAAQREIESGYQRLQEAQNTYVDLGDKFKQLATLEKQFAALNRKLDADRFQIQGQADQCRERIRQAESDINSAQKTASELAQVEIDLHTLETLKDERDAIIEGQTALNKESATLQEQNKTLRTEMDDIKQRMTILDNADGAACPVCGQPLLDDHRDHLKEQYQGDGKIRGNTFRANNNRLKEIEKVLDANKKRSAEIDKELHRFDTLKKRQGVLSERAMKGQQAEAQLQVEQESLAQLVIMLQEENYSLGLRAEINNVQQQIASLDYDQDAHNEAREALTTLRIYEEQKRTLQTALESLVDVEMNLASIQERRDKITSQLSDEQVVQSNLQVEVNRLVEEAKEANRRQEEWKRQRILERQAADNLAAVRQQLKAIEDARRRKGELITQRDALREEEAIYKELREAFGKNGVPAMIIEAAIPELEEATNRILSRISSNTMHIRFDTQRERKSGVGGGPIETLDILISDELGTRSYDMFSGGEGFRVNFALRIALSQFLARRAGARLEILMIDEGFGSQDTIGRERLVEAINAIRSDFELILIVTHIEEMLELFPSTIEVHKTPSGSIVSVR